MKKLLAAVMMLAVAASCEKHGELFTDGNRAPMITASTSNDEQGGVKTTITVDDEGVGTIWWKPGDLVSIFIDKTNVKYFSLNTENATTAIFDSNVIIGSTESSSSGKWGLYPYDAAATCDGSSVTTTIHAAQNGVPDTFDDNLFPMLAHSFTNEMTFYNVCGGIKFSLSRDDIKKITFKGNNDENLVGKVKLTMDEGGRPSATAVSGEKVITLTPKTGSTFAKNTNCYLVMLPTVLTNGFTMTFETENQVGTFEYTAKSVEIKRSVFAKKAEIDGYATFKAKTVIPDGAVDLGLSVMWATCNLGASKPEDCGGYYQWAGLQDVTDTSIYLDESNCPYHTGSDQFTGWTKYFPSDKSSYWSGSGSPDNKTVLDPEDDVAYVSLSGKWRMPTIDEFQELMDNCTSEWTALNGVKGRKFTSNKNGNSIFLPAAGCRSGNYLYSAGLEGSYWSSSLYTTDIPPHSACGFYYSSSSYDVCTEYYVRCLGQSIRPVYGDRVNVAGVSLNKTDISLEIGAIFNLSATVVPSNAAERSVSWSSSNTSIATVDASGIVTGIKAGSAIITVMSTDGGYIATCGVTINSSKPVTPEAVDLGLPSGIKWASFNLGATKPEEYGRYYQWAGLQDVTDISIYLDLSNCPYHTGSSSSSGWTKYIPSYKSSYWSGSGSPDNKTVLDPEDDVAHVKLGGKWRMPTDSEFEELLDNCTLEWTALNGVNGQKFTSKKNGNSIFLPAAGSRSGDHLTSAGSSGFYWSSALSKADPYDACGFSFYPNDDGYTNVSYRLLGKPVRPVSE